jgi:hypothetical protein
MKKMPTYAAVWFRMLTITLSLVLVIHYTDIIANETQLRKPTNYLNAIGKGTRSECGRPGGQYWTNAADYTLTARIDVSKGYLYGSAAIIYDNNSPDTLDQIVLRLYHDFYKAGNIRNHPIRPADIGEGVVISSLTVEGREVNQTDRNESYRVGTNLVIRLKDLVNPGGNVAISAEWHYKIPEHTFLRTGRIDSTAYFIAYWYPQVAIYDDLFGWDMVSYKGLQEFNQGFSNFDVKITVPAGFGVWATGLPRNPEEIFTPSFNNQLQSAWNSNTTTRLFNQKDNHTHFIASEGEITWHYKAEKVPDFAFLIGNDFIWDASSHETGNNRVMLNAVYKKEAVDFETIIPATKKVVDDLSNRYESLVYPFPVLNMLHGIRDAQDGGMEFPMISNLPTSGDNIGRRDNINSHEIAHMFFPFYVGANENRWGWMDEGLAGVLPVHFMRQNHPQTDRMELYKSIIEMVSGSGNDVPVMTPTFLLNSRTIFTPTYAKPALGLLFLKEYLGNEIFSKAINDFVNNWKYRHPSPWDFFNTFNRVSNQNLNWFFEKWFFGTNWPDPGIISAETRNESTKLILENKGGLPVPITISITMETGLVYHMEKDISIWKDGGLVTINIDGSPVKIEIGGVYTPDSDRSNNTYVLEAE